MTTGLNYTSGVMLVISPTLTVGIIAALVAICGYMITTTMNRIERRSRIYAEAISALIQFQELPYRIRRRPDSTGTTRAAVYQRVRDAQEALSYYIVLLRLDSPKVGNAFDELAKTTREKGVQHRRDAWAAPPATRDDDMNIVISYKYNNETELEKCITLMQHELSMIRVLFPQARLLRPRRQEHNAARQTR